MTFWDRSPIATGTSRIDRQRRSLTPVVQVAVDLMRARIAAAGLEIHLSVSDADLPVYGDAIQLQQVLTNLVSNAIKFTEKESTFRWAS